MRFQLAARLLLCSILLPAGNLGCKRSRSPTEPAAADPPVPTLGSITVQDLTPEPLRPKDARIEATALEQRARQILEQAGLFAAPSSQDGSGAVAIRVRVEVAIEDVVAGDKGAARAVLRLRIDTRPGGVAPPRWNEDVQAGAETVYAPGETPDRQPLFQKLVARTLEDLLTGYIARQKLWTGDAAAVRNALGADAGELRLEAIRVVGERKLAGEAQRLLALLEHPDEAVRDAALGALVELRERRAVSVLARARSMRDRREMRKILEAISILGGEEAADYLSFIAEGHDDPELRQIAADARRRLERRQGSAPTER
jgi:hypothetical protein